jgi:hypothetical protein
MIGKHFACRAVQRRRGEPCIDGPAGGNVRRDLIWWVRRQSVLPFLTFEPEIQTETDQKSPKNPGKRRQNPHEVPVPVDNGNCYSREQRTVDDTVKPFYSIR